MIASRVAGFYPAAGNGVGLLPLVSYRFGDPFNRNRRNFTDSRYRVIVENSNKGVNRPHRRYAALSQAGFFFDKQRQ